MKLNWLFKKEKTIVKEIIDEFITNEGLFIQKFASDENWRDDILSSLYSYVGSAPIWMKDNQNTYVDAYQHNNALYAIVNMIAREAKKIKWKLYALDTSDKMNVKQEKIEVEDYMHDLLKLLNFRANPLQSGSEWLEEAIIWKLLTGNNYCYMAGPGNDLDKPIDQITIDDIEAPKELWNLPAHLTRINSEGAMKPISYYDVLYKNTIKLPPERVIHTKSFNPDYSSVASNLYGMSPLRAGLKVLQNSDDTYTAASKLLQSLGAFGIIFKDGDGEFSEENAQTLANQYERKLGPQNIKKMLFAGAKLGWIKLSDSAADLNLYTAMRQSQRELANIFGISTILLNDPENSATFANYSEAKKSLWTNAVLPHLTQVRDDLNYQLVPLFSKRDGLTYYIDMDLSDVSELKPDLQVMSEVADRSWWLTVGEKREMLGFDTFDDESLNEMILVPNGLTPIEESSLNFVPNDNTLTNFEDDTDVENT